MKTKKQNKILLILFFVVFAILLTLSIISGFMYKIPREDINRNVNFVEDVVRIGVDDKKDYSEINSYYKEFIERKKSKDIIFSFEQASVDLMALSASKDNYASDEKLFIDDKGFVTAKENGIYKLQYVLKTKDMDRVGLFKLNSTSYSHIYTNIIVAIDGDYSNYIPLDSRTTHFDPYAKYIVAEDFVLNQTLEMEMFAQSFFGTIINPYGHTITINNSSIGYPILGFASNYGIIDGLKLFYDVENFNSKLVYVADLNYGYIGNCDVSGYAGVDGMELLSATGWVKGNVSNLEVSLDKDLEINVFKTNRFLGLSDTITSNWIARDNNLKIDLHAVEGNVVEDVKSSKRNIIVDKDMLAKNNTVSRRDGKMINYDKRHVVHLKIPTYSLQYANLSLTCYDNGFIELDSNIRNTILQSANNVEQDNIFVEGWLVDGVKVDSLDEILVTKDLQCEPIVRYKQDVPYCIFDGNNGGVYYLRNVYLSGNILRIAPPSQLNDFSTVFMDKDILKNFFENPRNNKPEKIIISQRARPEYARATFSNESLKYLNEFLKDGGVLEVEDNHPDFTLYDGRMLCLDNSSLLYYFRVDDEEDIWLDEHITFIYENAFIESKEIKFIDLSNVYGVNLNLVYAGENDIGGLNNCINLEKVILSNHVDCYNPIRSLKLPLSTLLSKLTSLSEIEVREESIFYEMKDGFLVDNGSVLVYSLKRFGTVSIPNHINHVVYESCFGQSTIEQIVFEDGEYDIEVNEKCFKGLNNLQRIIFGNVKSIDMKNDGEIVEYEKLAELEFDDNIQWMYFSPLCFLGANLDKITLPSALKGYSYLPICGEYEINNSTRGFFTRDGVLYSKNGEDYVLVSYPAGKMDDSYEIMEGVTLVLDGAFRYSKVKTVICNDELTSIGREGDGCGVFYSSQIESFVGSKVEIIGARAFEKCENLTSLTLSSNICVYHGAFACCKKLEQIPSTIVGLSGMEYDNAFIGCEKLISIRFNLEADCSFSRNMFDGCAALTSIEVECYSICFKDDVFANCECLLFVYVKQNGTGGNIDQGAFKSVDHKIHLILDVDSSFRIDYEINENVMIEVSDELYQQVILLWNLKPNQLYVTTFD